MWAKAQGFSRNLSQGLIFPARAHSVLIKPATWAGGSHPNFILMDTEAQRGTGAVQVPSDGGTDSLSVGAGLKSLGSSLPS